MKKNPSNLWFITRVLIVVGGTILRSIRAKWPSRHIRPALVYKMDPRCTDRRDLSERFR